MECPFVEVGCNVTKIPTNASYQQHLSQSTEQHLQMVMTLHEQTLGYDSSRSSAAVTLTSLTSPLQKLSAVNQEVQFLESVLESYGMSQIPALECIKTQLSLPDIWLRSLGDICAFRMPEYSQKRKSKSKWLSPPFYVQGGYKMCLCVYANGVKSGTNSHTSVSLLLMFDDQLEWPISLPPNIGIGVELMQDEAADPESDEDDSEIGLTWKPKGDEEAHAKCEGFRKKPATSMESSKNKHKKSLKKSSSLPPWCTQPPDFEKEESTSQHSYVSTQSTDSIQDEDAEGVVLILSEKFASHSVIKQYTENFNSLVFRVTLCFV